MMVLVVVSPDLMLMSSSIRIGEEKLREEYQRLVERKTRSVSLSVCLSVCLILPSISLCPH